MPKAYGECAKRREVVKRAVAKWRANHPAKHRLLSRATVAAWRARQAARKAYALAEALAED